jgi:hypothetical protein
MNENIGRVEFEGEITEPLRGRTLADAVCRMRGTMLWFNESKRLGVLRTADGDRVEVAGSAFVPGEEPVGRCGGKLVEFEAHEGAVAGISFVPDSSPRRARRRHRG